MLGGLGIASLDGLCQTDRRLGARVPSKFDSRRRGAKEFYSAHWASYFDKGSNDYFVSQGVPHCAEACGGGGAGTQCATHTCLTLHIPGCSAHIRSGAPHLHIQQQ